MKIKNSVFEYFMFRIKKTFRDIFDNPIGRPAKKILITVVGTVITLLGVMLIILPGPAFLFIPVGLAVLATEYPIARKWLRKFQHWMTVSAKKADQFLASKKTRFNFFKTK